RASMIADGWRPLTTGYGAANGASAGSSERNGVHPVLDEVEDRLASSEKQKPRTKVQSQDYAPPSILGSFSVFGHAATKARVKSKDHIKHVPSETREYSFLIPPPRDAFRFDVDPQRKSVLRNQEIFPRQPTYVPQAHQQDVRNQPFVPQSHHADIRNRQQYLSQAHQEDLRNQYIPQAHQTDVRNQPFVSKGPVFSSTPHPQIFSKTRPGPTGFGGQEIYQPTRHQIASSESVKVTNTKPFLQPPNVDVAKAFEAEKINGHPYEGYHLQSHSGQALNGRTGNYFNQIYHPTPYKTYFERDPAFLIHESHEVSYVRPREKFPFNFRQPLPYESLSPPNNYSPTTPSGTETSKFVPYRVNNDPSGGFDRKPLEDSRKHANKLPQVPQTNGIPSSYYFPEQQTVTTPTPIWSNPTPMYTTEINEVLPRKNPPPRFNQEPENANRNVHYHQPAPEVVYIRPPQYQSSARPVIVHQQKPQEVEYETPESISLKHFNEQQFALQQQLLQQDRQRLREQELQQREIERQENAELRKEQEANARDRTKQVVQEEVVPEGISGFHEPPKQEGVGQIEHYVVEGQKKVPEEQTYTVLPQQQQVVHFQLSTVPSTKVEESPNPYEEQLKKPQAFEEVATDLQRIPDQRPREPNRAQKPFRNQNRRRRPNVTPRPTYEISSSETPSQNFETYETASPEPEVSTYVSTSRPRSRRPDAPLRRRRPIASTAEAETERPAISDDAVEYERPATSQDPIQDERPTPGRDSVAPERPVISQDLSKYERPVTNRSESLAYENPGTGGEDFSKYEGPGSRDGDSKKYERPQTSQGDSKYERPDGDYSKTRQRPSPSTDPDSEPERRPVIRKRPGHRLRVQPGEPFEAEIVTEPVQAPKTTQQQIIEWGTYYESNKDPSQQSEVTSAEPRATFPPRFEEGSTESVGEPEGSYPQKTRFEETYAQNAPPTESFQNGNGNIPLENLFGKPERNHVGYYTTAIPDESYDPPVTTTTEIATTTSEATSTKRSHHRIRPMRFGNSTRPRFSVKDYKSRMDFKNKLSQSSTTEAPQASTPSSHRGTTTRPQEAQEAPKRDNGRYRYTSRGYGRTSSTTVGYEQAEPETGTGTTEKPNGFVPKRKPNNGHLYRSRFTTSTASPRKQENEVSVRLGTARPENVFSSSIRKRPLRKRVHQQKESKKEGSTEMAAAESSFYPSTTVFHLPATVNEIIETPDDGTREASTDVATTDTHVAEPDSEQPEQDTNPPAVETPTTVTDLYSDEELFAKASQSVADLTVSASALYDKPGMFKAVSPATETRGGANRFRVITDEPTLPIEAFFQELSKND
ncbi:altered inheritance of mitochondria protein 3-like, partial [Orussus abietinus]|uniref:altered inheritance of mitochondria protein 3-like n=1 Tax=Orussus abietinus TaxID=222816 RepID=UPI0006262F9D